MKPLRLAILLWSLPVLFIVEPAWASFGEYIGALFIQIGPEDPNTLSPYGAALDSVQFASGNEVSGPVQLGKRAFGSMGPYIDPTASHFYYTGLTRTFPPPATNPGGAIPLFIGGSALTLGLEPATLAPSGAGTRFGGVMRQLGRRVLRFATWPDAADFLTLEVPLGAVGGTPGETRTATAGSGQLAVTVTGGPWRTGTLMVTESRGKQVTTLTATGFDERRTPHGGRGPVWAGDIQLVAPIAVHLGGSIGPEAEDHQVGIATLSLNLYAPEPSVGLLFLAGAPVALLLGVLRKRR